MLSFWMARSVKMKVLYLDVLFLINFCLDYMALHLTGMLLHRRRAVSRLLAASLFGALYATVSVFYPGNALIQTGIGIVVSLVMTLFVYGFSTRRFFLRTSLVFYVVSLLLGALVTVFYSTLNRFVSMEELTTGFSDRKIGVFFLASAAAGVLIRMASIWMAKSGQTAHECTLLAELFGKKVSFKALLDSGNLLVDPLSGRRVVVVNMQAVRFALPPPLLKMLAKDPPDPTALPYSIARRIRLIPVDGVGGKRLLVGVVPDRLVLKREDGRANKEAALDAILAIDTEKGADYGGCEGIMPMSLAA